ncbi:MAG TPA: LysR family transcriptional regulator, partial [Magnetospirillum sp.]|nr:LysR family transcriptional regulator [Magnetospirillum sp.]
MDTAALRLFRAVARTGSVGAAAEQVHSVPSNISARVRKLEEELGAPLFLREPRGMRLTPAGEVLLDYAERILALTAEARDAVRESVGEGGVLRLASMETTAAVRLPPLLAAFHRSHPKVTLTLSTGTSEAQVQAVLERRADL